MANPLDHPQSINREKNIQEELERIGAKTEKSAEDHARVQNLLREFREVHAHRMDLEHDAALAEIRSATATDKVAEHGTDVGGEPTVVERGAPSERYGSGPAMTGKFRNPWDTSTVRFGQPGADRELRNRAEDAIERMPHASDKVREAAAKFVERDDSARNSVAEMVLGTTSPEYMAAFSKVVRSKGQMAALTGQEQASISRAMSLVDANGGFAVPFQLDPTVILTANGSFNEVRKIARVVTATGDVWHGISSAGVTGSWDAEAAEVSDDSPSFAQPSIPVHKGAVFVQQSFEVEADAGLASEIASMIAFEKDRMESVAFVSGSGTGQPKGIVTALAGGSSEVMTAAVATLAVSDVYDLDSALPARFAANASWLAHRKVYNAVRQFDQNGGGSLWGQLADGRKGDLLGRPNYVAEAMDSDDTAGNNLLVFGDFQNYVISDRLGTTLSYVPHIFGANRRPTGESGWYAHFRVGADVVNPGAFRLLTSKTV